MSAPFETIPSIVDSMCIYGGFIRIACAGAHDRIGSVLLGVLSVTEWTAIIGSAVALVALGLSVTSLLMQRAHPFLEAQLINHLTTGNAAVAVRNSGSRSARAPLVMFAVTDGSIFFCNHVGNGFLGPGEGRLLLTMAPALVEVSGQATVEGRGIVGYFDRKDRLIVRPFGGGRPRKFRSGEHALDEIFRIFYPNVPLGNQVALRKDTPLT